MEKKNVVLLTVIAVATLLTAMVGSTFAFFTASVSGGGGTEDVVNVQTATVTANFTDGSKIDVTGIAPSWEGTKDITIENKSDVAEMDYEIHFLDSYTNGFTNLEYKLELKDGENQNKTSNIDGVTTDAENQNFKKMETASLKGTSDNKKNVLVTGHLTPGAKNEFTLTIRLKETNADQTTDDSNKTFTGKLEAKANVSKKTS